MTKLPMRVPRDGVLSNTILVAEWDTAMFHEPQGVSPGFVAPSAGWINQTSGNVLARGGGGNHIAGLFVFHTTNVFNSPG
jgi:hypothetical protein